MEEKCLGKPLWSAVEALVPRVQADGGLLMPDNSVVDLAALQRAMPQLPYVAAAPAQTRALALLDAAGGAWTTELAAQARACFEAEAANIQVVLCIPEVTARGELMADPLCVVRDEDGAAVGCKLFCPV